MTEGERPLSGLKVLVTRARDQSEKFRALLEPLGAQVSELPVIEITAPDDFSQLDGALKQLDKYDWMILASGNAVQYTLDRATAIGVDATAASGLKFAAVGPATADALAARGLNVDFCPSTFVAENLTEEFPGYPHLEGKRILWPRTNIGRTLISDRLAAAGARVDAVLAYLTGLPANPEELGQSLVKQLDDRQVDVITLASGQSARNLAQLIQIGLSGMSGKQPNSVQTLLAPVKIAVIGPITAAAARECLGRVDIEAGEHTLSGLAEALLASLKFG